MNPENPKSDESTPQDSPTKKKGGASIISRIWNLAALGAMAGGYYYFIHHTPGPGEFDDVAIDEWIQTQHGISEVEWDKESPKGEKDEILGTEFELYFGTAKKSGKDCSVHFYQHEDARLLLAKTSCAVDEGEPEEKVTSSSHYAFGPLGPLGTSDGNSRTATDSGTPNSGTL